MAAIAAFAPPSNKASPAHIRGLPAVTDISTISIVPFESRHAKTFRDLNVAWVEHYFGTVEEKDFYLLDAPEDRIIRNGGAVLIAEDAGVAIGCVALVPAETGEVELAKMAVADEAKGKGVGRKLMDAAIATARALGAESIYLESNSGLTPAVMLYERAGFVHLSPSERPISPYARCDVYMRLRL
jgi:putative acetyltransferase